MSAPLSIFVPHGSDLFTNHQAHGDGLVACEVAMRLAQRGHDVHVAAPCVDVTGPVPPNLHLYEVPLTGHSAAFGRVRYMIDVRRLFDKLRRKHRIDIVHQLNPVFTGISLAIAGARIPVVLGSFVGEWPESGEAQSSFAARAKRGIALVQQRNAHALLVTTPAARARIVDLRRDGRKVVTLPHGIDLSQYTVADAPAATDAPTLLFLGGIERRKGIYTLLDAFRIVQQALPKSRLVYAGWGWEVGPLLEAVRQMPAEMQPNVSVMGAVPRSDVPRLMRECTVFCMPSYGEPFGMSLLEAMASGKPVVVTKAGGADHIVDAQGARKIPVGDHVELARALLDIVASPSLQEQMGRHNREIVETTYSWERVIARLEDIYRNVLRTNAVGA